MSSNIEQFFSRTIAWMQQAVRWRATPDEGVLLSAAINASPLLVVSSEAAQSEAGQVLARLAVRVLTRVFPGTEIQVYGNEALQRDLEGIAGEALGYRAAGRERVGTVVIGETGISPGGLRDAIFVGGDGATARLDQQAVQVGRTLGAPPALFAASLAAAEITKLFLRRLCAEYGGRWTEWDLEPTVTLDVRIGTTAHPSGPVNLGQFLIVSGGAVTHAALAALLETPRVQGQGTVFDDQCAEISNGNRYLLLSSTDAERGAAKVDVIRALSRPGFALEGVRQLYSPGHSRARLVLIGADRISARLDAQRDEHDFIVNGATELDYVRASCHRRNSGVACLGCINPDADPEERGIAPTIAFVSAAAGACVAAGAIDVAQETAVPGLVLDMRTLQPRRVGNLSCDVRPSQPSCKVGACRRQN